MVSNLLNNILFILAPILLFQHYWSENKKRDKKVIVSIVLLASVSIVLCMTFPFQAANGWYFDLRHVPLVILTLYGGYQLGIFPFLTIIIYRFLIGGDGVFVALITQSVFFIAVVSVSPFFNVQRSKTKLYILTGIATILISFTIFMSFIFIEDVNGFSITLILPYILIQGITAWIATVLIELIRNRDIMKQEITKSDKSKLVSDLAASISHEVRNPLTVTKGFLQLLRDNDFTKDKREQFFDLAIKELEHAETIITDYLTFAKPDSDRRQIINAYEELNKSVEIIKSYANMRSVAIETEFLDRTSWVLGERQKLHQCIMNISKNSIDAMPSGGLLHVRLESDDDFVTIIINDTGIGMNTKQIEQLGVPYFTTKEHGTGLGMMVVMNIVKSMKGKIKYMSKPGEGTTVLLTFPKVEQQQMSKLDQIHSLSSSEKASDISI
ncbi:sensor histidine kinase [Calidifontibacillus oryziterrae]|uniref:sensor histidine kinase n=1 Tax=Calidifontibacillus oryziterrae TaxID=1191699 RepID=UPI0002EFC3C7|nr:HAMP domain-containing sensor histidine kinase [Calidifontibacillus oryziterrae]